MGEGGAILTNSMKLARICESYRDWGAIAIVSREKITLAIKDLIGSLDLPEGYDHKYTYSHIGYNLKVSDMQAALGVSQLKKLDYFIARRRENFKGLAERMRACGLDNHFILPEPRRIPIHHGLVSY